MNSFITYSVLALIFGAIGFLIGKLLGKLQFETSKTFLEKEKSSLEERIISEQKNIIAKEQEKNLLAIENKKLQEEKEFLLTVKTRQESDLDNLQTKLNEQKLEVEKLQEKFTKEFENLANKILDEKSTKFTQQNKENMETILNPLQEKIKGFEDKVEKTHKESIDYHAALRQQIIGLKELNQQMSKETLNLTKALKGD
ncbi:MAG: DNA recombination protein RmuC, partial [Polaribacter sp.]|nr:DNA recombination protein RmuC [Polaribacter sp.]